MKNESKDFQVCREGVKSVQSNGVRQPLHKRELNSEDEGDNVIAQKVNFEKIDSGKGNDQDNIQVPEAELVSSDVSFDSKDCREETKPNLVKFSNITEMADSRGQSKKIMRRQIMSHR